MRIKGNNTISLLITLGILSLLLIPSSERMVAESTLDKVVIAYGRSGQTISNATNPLNLQDIPTKKNPCR
jgi:hypothetical protein